MIIAGLTGSIGMGKSTVGAMFGDLGAAVLDSDAIVHKLYERDGRAVEPVSCVFPDAIVDGAVDRALLSRFVIGHPDAMKKLEAIVHPLVKDEQKIFIETARDEGKPMVLLDIPLLFETGAQDRFDHIIVVSSPASIQRKRVLSRSGMTDDKFEQLLSRQMPDAEKREKANTVIDTSGDLEATRKQVLKIYEHLTGGIH